MSQIKTYPFYSVLSYLHDEFDIDMNPDKFENTALTGWQWIGNKEVLMYKAKLHPVPDGEGRYVAQVPCNCDIIESITTNYEDFQKTSATRNFPGTFAATTESFIEGSKYDNPDFYQSGKLVNYRRVGDCLYFTDNFSELNILYKGVYADEDGLPFLSFKEMDAIATFCAYMNVRKKALKTQDGNTYQLSEALKTEWLRKCSQARVPEYIDQNEMNTILDAKTSWDRKCYNRSFKPVT